jgi:hypothetical protein
VDPASPPANLKVNDVHTAELTRELAARLGAAAVINRGCDRNVLDLNRTSQVRRQASWFLDLLRDEIASVLARFERAELLFIHGWNVGQAKCDFGIGARETVTGLATPNGAALTVTRGYLEGRLEPLRTTLERKRIETFIGVRYPASHPNNLLQAFTPRGADQALTSAEKQFAVWASEGRLEAIQLELGVPLRWPGVWRNHLVESIAGHFDGGRATIKVPRNAASRVTVDKYTSRLLTSTDSRRATSLQFYDPVADVGLLAGVGPIGQETSAARLLLFLGGQRVALFTGEQNPSMSLVVEPLRFERDELATRLSFSGPILHLEDGATYLDLEAAFVASTLGELEVELCFRRCGAGPTGAEFGQVEGRVDLGGERRTISVGAYANAAAARVRQSPGYTMFTADFGRGQFLANIGSEGTNVVEFCNGLRLREATSPRTLLRRDRHPWMSCWRMAASCAQPRSRMEILRSLPGGRTSRNFRHGTISMGGPARTWGSGAPH